MFPTHVVLFSLTRDENNMTVYSTAADSAEALEMACKLQNTGEVVQILEWEVAEWMGLVA